jgi:uncharacterized protein YbjT (DUF2867 family)
MNVVVTGGTGYIGRALIELLVTRGHDVVALVRAGSRDKLPPGATPIIGDALDAATFAQSLPRNATLVHLVGTPHPNPSKALEFERVDLASIKASIEAARRAAVTHLVYVSVAQPAPVMRAYVAARGAGEAAIANAGLTATMLRPWYVIGPGHRWPILLKPVYWLLERLPFTRESARRLGLVTIEQIVIALATAVEHLPTTGTIRIIDVPGIRAAKLGEPSRR